MKTIIFIVSLATFATGNYSNYKVYTLSASSQQDVDAIYKLKNVDFWSHIGQTSTVMVAPQDQPTFLHTLKKNHIEFEEMIENVERVVHRERVENAAVLKGNANLERYNDYDTIAKYLSQLAHEYPDIVRVASAGKSFEGRHITYITISTGGKGKPIIFIDAGIHAREWIAPATVLNFIQLLVADERNRAMIENVDWMIVPVANPDGYEYTRHTARFWRKTRSKGRHCDGVDANRNFGYHWMGDGASDDECATTYAGPRAFSEPETRAMRRLLQAHAEKIRLYLTFHSYGQYILYPWGYTSNLPENVDTLDALGRNVADAIREVAGTEYTVGSSTNVLYPAAGGSDDWAKGVAGIELSYTIELPGGGANGFDPPASAIRNITVETWQGIKVYHEYIERLYTCSSVPSQMQPRLTTFRDYDN